MRCVGEEETGCIKQNESRGPGGRSCTVCLRARVLTEFGRGMRPPPHLQSGSQRSVSHHPRQLALHRDSTRRRQPSRSFPLPLNQASTRPTCPDTPQRWTAATRCPRPRPSSRLVSQPVSFRRTQADAGAVASGSLLPRLVSRLGRGTPSARPRPSRTAAVSSLHSILRRRRRRVVAHAHASCRVS